MSISFIASCLQTQPMPDFDSAIEEGLKLAEKSLNDNPSIICFPEYCGGLKSQNGRFIPPHTDCLLYTSTRPRDRQKCRMPSSS